MPKKINIFGYWRVHLVSADPMGTFLLLQNAGVTLLDPIMEDGLTWQFSVARRDGKIVKDAAEKRGDRVEFTEQKGILASVCKLKRRPTLFVGLGLLLLLSWWASDRVLFVQVEGNHRIPQRLIIEEAGKCGIRLGAGRKEVRSQKMKNALLESVPQLQWAGITTEGCVAVIQVKERDPQPPAESTEGVCSIVAKQDAILSSVTVLRGNALCAPGQAVKAGQVLISGYTDCGICIRAEHASGEVFGHTQRRISAVFPTHGMRKAQIDHVEKKYSLIIGKKQINFFQDSGILGMSCAKIYEQKCLRLPGGFQLPISLLCQQIIYYDSATHTETMPEEQMQEIIRQYLQMQLGSGKIEHSQVYFSAGDDCVKFRGIFGCLEDIGQVKMEERIPEYGKSN